MATAKKLKSGSWRCLVYDYTDENGKRHYKSFTCSDPSTKGKRAAEKLAADYAAEKEKKQRGASEYTFSELIENYIEEKESVLSPSTIRSYKTIQDMIKELYPSFYKMKISRMQPSDVQKIINDLSKTKNPKTVRNYYGLISAAIGSNLALNTTIPQKVQPDLYIPSDDEIRALVNAVKDTELEIPVLLGAFCMMRRGEICGLSLEDIQGNVVHIHHSLVIGPDRQWHMKAPKTDSSDRYIEIPYFIADKIRKKGYITNYNPDSLTTAFRKILKRNGLNHFRFHDLRHYSASIRHALGIPDAYIMSDGGWSSDRVLKSVYRHAMNDRKKEMSSIANSHFEELCNTKCNTK